MASDGSDNPILDMGLLGMMQPNPYLNPAYANKPLALPGFRGVATNAMGQPIGAPAAAPAQGTTLNTPGPGAAPAAPMTGQPSGTFNYGAMGSAGAPLQELMGNYQAAQAKLSPQEQYNQQQANQVRQQNIQNQNTLATVRGAQGGFGNMPGGAFNPGMTNYSAPPMAGSSQPSAPATPSSGTDPRQAYLDALANPGNPPLVGAAVPASHPLGTPSVLNAFLAAHPSGGSKTGGYDNTGFFNTLNSLGRTA